MWGMSVPKIKYFQTEFEMEIVQKIRYNVPHIFSVFICSPKTVDQENVDSTLAIRLKLTKIAVHHINKLEDKNHMIISFDAENAFDKNPTCRHDKVKERLGIQRTYLNTIKAVYNKPIANIKLSGKNSK